MEIKVSTTLETALEFISDMATCKTEEYKEKSLLAYSFIQSLKDEISDKLKERLEYIYADISDIRKIIADKKRIGD